MKFKNRIITVLFFLASVVNAQDPYYVNFDTKDGLPSSEVYNAFVDQKERIWFATDRGIGVYNGYEFDTYTVNDGLANNTIFKIVGDGYNRIWFLGNNASLSYFFEGQINSYPLDDYIPNIKEKVTTQVH